MERILAPELLDDLPVNDAAAIRSRADLQRLNRMMGNAGTIVGALRQQPSVKRLCDLGSGDGTLMLRIARKLGWRDVNLTMIDRRGALPPGTEDAFSALGWSVTVKAQDVFEALNESRRFDAIVANLFLHHFAAPELTKLMGLAATRAPFFVGCEPKRSAFALVASRCIGAVGCGAVTRHDAIISVRAGFRDRELSALWPDKAGWNLEENAAGLFSQLFVARKK